MSDHRFVAHLDILGMSSIVERDADSAWGLLSSLVSIRDEAEAYELEFLDSTERVRISETIRSVTFSDTILLFTKGCADTDLRSLIIIATHIFQEALSYCVPIRAGISAGTFYFNIDKSMYAGPALIDAYRCGEAAQWIGICLSSSVEAQAKALNMKTGEVNVIVPWAVPTKNGLCHCSVINWPAITANNFTVKPPLCAQQFYEPFKETFGAFVRQSADVQAKYQNTVDFVNAQLQKVPI